LTSIATSRRNGGSDRSREGLSRVPIRRTRWTSFWVGLAAVVIAALTAALSVAALGVSLTLSGVGFDGFWVVFLFALLWFGLFFLSYPLQRRYARSRDLRRPCISFVEGILTVPPAAESVLNFNLDEPHELRLGWCEQVMTSAGGPTGNTRAVWTHALLSQGGRGLLLIAEDSVREAQSAGWPKTPDASTASTPRVRLWACDLVPLAEAMRAWGGTAARGTPPS
jgi:hypothetical protein